MMNKPVVMYGIVHERNGPVIAYSDPRVAEGWVRFAPVYRMVKLVEELPPPAKRPREGCLHAARLQMLPKTADLWLCADCDVLTYGDKSEPAPRVERIS